VPRFGRRERRRRRKAANDIHPIRSAPGKEPLSVSAAMAVPDDIQAKYADFLKLPETGIVKLMPRGMHNDVMPSRMEDGAYYSFCSPVSRIRSWE